MINVLRAEWFKLMRKGMLLGGALTMVALAALLGILLLATAQVDPQVPTSPADRPGLPLALFAGPDGLSTSFGMVGQLMGVVSLVIAAQNIGSEYTHSTLKVQLSREPRRLVLLSGKIAATSAFLAASIVAAAVVHAAVTTAVASARGLDAGAWWSIEGMTSSASILGRVMIGAVAMSAMGLLLGVALRSAAPAIGIGVGYTIVVEPILALAAPSIAQFLPGQAINAFLSAGSKFATNSGSALEFAPAAVLMIAYSCLFIAISLVLFRQRDVSN